MYVNQDYTYETFEEWFIGDEDQNIGETYVDGQGHYELVDAEVYRGMWSFREDHNDFRKYERFDFTESKLLDSEDIAIDRLLNKTEEELDAIRDEDGQIKMAQDLKSDITSTHTEDLFYKGEMDDLDIGEFDINGMAYSTSRDENRVASIGYEYMYKESFGFSLQFNLITQDAEYCYDTMVDWNIGDEDGQEIGCTFIDGLPHHEEVRAEIFRSQWNYNYYTAANDINPEFEKFEISKFTLAPTILEDMKINELGEDTDVKDSSSIIETDDFGFDDMAKDEHDLRIDDFDIGGEHDNDETASSRKVFIGYEYMFQDAANISESIMGTPTTKYSYNTFIMIYIGDELNIADDEDYIDGKGVNIDIEADLYRGHWNNHDDDMITVDNVITEKYEIVGLKMYREDDEGNWVYLPDNNIEAAD
jgi:hypothetical protein